MKALHIRLLAFGFIVSLMSIPQSAFSVGTPAGTVIQTRSKVTYTTSSGSISDTVYSNYVTFTVAQVAAINITPASNAQSTNKDSVYVEYAMTVTNSGNGTDQFNLSYVSSKGWNGALYFDTNGDGLLQAGELGAGSISQTASINADATYNLILRMFAPRDPSLDGQTDTTTVTATSVFDNTKSNSAEARTTVNTVYFDAITSGWSINPSNPSPGDNVVYTMTVSNDGSVNATNVTFSDLINNTQFTFISANTTQGTINTSGNPIIWNAGTVNAGSSVTISITLQVNSGLDNGTILNNTITTNYTVNGNTFSVTSNNPAAAVGVTYGVSITPALLSSTNEPDDTLAYYFTVKNTGNTKDVLELEYNSSQGYAWSFIRDVNGNGAIDAGDLQLTNTNGSGGVDVDSVAASDSVKIFARLVVPVVPADQTEEVTTVTVKSSFDPAKFQNASATTTINIPDLALTRSIQPSGSQPPGTEMTFTVTYQNNGHGKAYNVVITENEADSMTYVPNSVTIEGVNKTDLADGDEVTVTTVSGKKVISIQAGIINGLSSIRTITYKSVIN